MRFKDIIKVKSEELNSFKKGRKKGFYQNLEIESRMIVGRVILFIDEEDEALETGKSYAVEMYPRVSQDKDNNFWINWYILADSVKEN